MKAPSREKIETTKGIIEIRAFTRKEANDLQKISRKQKLAKTDKERFDLEDEQEAILTGCIVAGIEFLDDIEAGEYMHILKRISVLSREYKEKN